MTSPYAQLSECELETLRVIEYLQKQFDDPWVWLDHMKTVVSARGKPPMTIQTLKTNLDCLLIHGLIAKEIPPLLGYDYGRYRLTPSGTTQLFGAGGCDV